MDFSKMFSLVIFALVAASGASDQCPQDWALFKDSCYYVGKTFENFDNAQTECEYSGSTLAVITSEEENNFVKGLFTDDDATGAWIGAKDLSRDRWRWVESDEDFSYSDWANKDGKREARPVAFSSRRSRQQVCASLSKQYDWAWESKDCYISDGQKFVCESCLPQEECFNGSCYRLLCSSEHFLEAQEKCDALYGYIAHIDSEEESKFIKNFLNKAQIPEDKRNPGVLVGGIGGDSSWHWAFYEDDTELIKPSDYTDWADDAKNNEDHASDTNCIYLNRDHDWKWSYGFCYDERAVLCEIEDLPDPEDAIQG